MIVIGYSVLNYITYYLCFRLLTRWDANNDPVLTKAIVPTFGAILVAAQTAVVGHEFCGFFGQFAASVGWQVVAYYLIRDLLLR
jgi:hypothetical protein